MGLKIFALLLLFIFVPFTVYLGKQIKDSGDDDLYIPVGLGAMMVVGSIAILIFS